MFGLTNYSDATWTQNFVASIGGSVASITVAAPLDVVKTRIQNANFENKVGGVTIIRDMVRNEGFTAFFKGLTPKVLVVGPKLVFSFTLAQSLIPWFGKVRRGHPPLTTNPAVRLSGQKSCIACQPCCSAPQAPAQSRDQYM